MKVQCSIPELTITKGGLEKNKEVYVVTFYRDESTVEASKGHFDVKSWMGKGGVALAEQPGVVISPLIRGVNKDRPISLSGNGFNCYSVKDPGQFLRLAVFIIESDSDFTGLADEITNAMNSSVVRGLLDAAAKVGGPFGFIPVVAQYLPAIIGSIKEDDILGSHLHSGVLENQYGTDLMAAGETEGIYRTPLTGKHCRGTFCVEIF